MSVLLLSCFPVGTDRNVCPTPILFPSWDRQECSVLLQCLVSKLGQTGMSVLPGAFLSFQNATQNFSRRTLRNLIHKLNAPNALIRRYPSGYVVHNFLACFISA